MLVTLICCITDLSLYKANKVAMRFQTETEVKSGKGQFVCGARKCEEKEKMRTWEVNFAYKEDGEKKNALVKLRLCPDCSYKLNYHHKRKEVTKKKKRRKSEKKRKRKSGTERSDKKSKRHKQVCALVRKLPSSVDFSMQFFSLKNWNYP